LTSQNRRSPNVVLVVLDTWRADRMSCYGHSEPTTPHLDAFAAESTLFERAISPAQWTIPAHASLFTGEYPSTHLTTQIYDRHTPAWPTLAEYLGDAGYETVGFCNNPLLGVVENDLDRGFEHFYNYGGVLPTRPRLAERRPRRSGRLMDMVARQLNRLNGPLQDWLTHNDTLLGLMMHPWITPLWERHINFKGNIHQSIGDMVGFLRNRRRRDAERPLFAFLNLMETHLPYEPPARFSRDFSPTYHEDREARDFLRDYNHRTFDWIAPITAPFSDAQHRVLNEMYNAEVAYEDHVLRLLLDHLDEPETRDNTLVIITADHGEGLDHHGYVGHSLVVYEDLVRVPLIVRDPHRFPSGQRIRTPVSTRRIFHTILDAADLPKTPEEEDLEAFRASLAELRLASSLDDATPAQDAAFAEAYPPLTLVNLMVQKNADAVTQFRCRATRRTVYNHRKKLITVDDEPEELYDVVADPGEQKNLASRQTERVHTLYIRLQAILEEAKARRKPDQEGHAAIDLDKDSQVQKRLRALGYLE